MVGRGKPKQQPISFDNHPLVQQNPRLRSAYQQLLEIFPPQEAAQQMRNALSYGGAESALFHLMKAISSEGEYKIPPRMGHAGLMQNRDNWEGGTDYTKGY